MLLTPEDRTYLKHAISVEQKRRYVRETKLLKPAPTLLSEAERLERQRQKWRNWYHARKAREKGEEHWQPAASTVQAGATSTPSSSKRTPTSTT